MITIAGFAFICIVSEIIVYLHAIKWKVFPIRELNLIAMTAHQHKILGEGLTYDDVLLVPAFSEVLPREVSIKPSFLKT